MCKRYLHKYFLNFTIPIDQAMIGAVSTSCGAVFRRHAHLRCRLLVSFQNISQQIIDQASVPDLNQWLCGLLQGIGTAIGYHRASLLLSYYIGYIGHLSEGAHEFLDAFWKPLFYCKWKYIALPWQFIASKKSGQKSTFIAANNVCTLYIWNRIKMYIKSIHKWS